MTWQPSPVLYPDVELALTTAMRPLLPNGVVVSNRVPTTRAARMVIFIRDGGASANGRDVARVRCLVWDQTPQAATDLARTVVAQIQRIVNGAPFLAVEHQSGPYEIADDSGQPQRFLLFDITTRGVPAP